MGPEDATDAADAGATADVARPQEVADSGAQGGQWHPDGGDGYANAADQAQDASEIEAQGADALPDGPEAVDTSPKDLPDSATAYALPTSIGKAPKVDVKPWPPPCAKPGVAGDGGKGYDGENCFGPPNYCMYAGGSTITPGCSLDGQYCCYFSTTCTPCGWVSCFECPYSGPYCPPGCKDFLQTPAAPWITPACKDLAKIVSSFKCAVCGSDVYCEWATPP